MFKTKNTSNVKEIYQSIIDNSRSKIFYIDLDIDDSFESRFDLVILHSFIIFQYFIEIGDKKNPLSQSLFDFMFHDFENNLREMGFGDVSVNKKMKDLNKIFYDILIKLNTNMRGFNMSKKLSLKYFEKLHNNDNNWENFNKYFIRFYKFCYILYLHVAKDQSKFTNSQNFF